MTHLSKLLLAFTLCLSWLTPGLLMAQIGPPNSGTPTNNAYTFNQAVATYTNYTGGTVFQDGTTSGVGGGVDVDLMQTVTLPFSFPFNQRTVNQVTIYNNGFITLGSRQLPVGTTAGLSTVTAWVDGSIAGFATTITGSRAAGATPEIRYGTDGSDWIVQYKDVRGTADANMRLIFQIRLSPSGVIKVVYGASTVAATARTGQVGIRGGDNDISNRLIAAATSWTSSAVGTSATSTSSFGVSAPAVPANGLTYTWTPGTAVPAASYATLPYTQNFNSAFQTLAGMPEAVPDANYWRVWPMRGDQSWRRNDVATGYTSASGWTNYTTSPSVEAPASGTFLRFNSVTGSTSASPRLQGQIDLYVNASGAYNKQLKFDVKNVTGGDSLSVHYSTDGGANFTELDKMDVQGTSTTWVSKDYLLPINSATTVIRFIGRGSAATTASGHIAIDNVVVDIPACGGAPTDIAITSNLPTTSTFTWTNNGAATSGYSWSIRNATTNAITASGTLAAGVTTVSPTLPYSPSQPYYFRIRSVCSGGATLSQADSIYFPGGQNLMHFNIARQANTFTTIKGDPATQYFTWMNGTTTTQNMSNTLDFTNLAGSSFDFEFGGITQPGMRVSTEGFATFDLSTTPVYATGPLGAYTELGTHRRGGAVLAPFWENLLCGKPEGAPLLDSSIMYQVTGSEPSRTLIIEWNNMRTTASNTSHNFTFQLLINEGTDRIVFQYGTMQSYAIGSSTAASELTYGIGIRNWNTSTYPKLGEVLALQEENTNSFSHVRANRSATTAGYGANELTETPDGNYRYVFTPDVSTSPAPTARVWNVPPVNDDVPGAIDLGNPRAEVPASITGLKYSSRFASNSAGFDPNIVNINSGESNDDVWFKFNQPADGNAVITINGSYGYQPCFQLHNSDLTVNGPITEASALSQIATRSYTGITAGEYYVRVWHKAAGTPHVLTPVLQGDSVNSYTVTTLGTGYTTSPYPRLFMDGGNGEGAIWNVTSSTGTGTRRAGGKGYTVAPTAHVEHPGSGYTGEFAIAITDPPSIPANNDPSGAFAFAAPLSNSCTNEFTNQRTTGAMLTAPTNGVAACSGHNPDDDVWYKFDATSDLTIIKVSSTGGFNAAIQVFNSNGQTNPALFTQLSDGCAYVVTTPSEIAAVGTTAGQTYYVRVYNYGVGSGPSAGRFGICAYSGEAPGYELVQTNSTYTPISGGSVVSFSNNAEDTTLVNLPVPVLINGATFSQAYVSTNGFITFGGGMSTATYSPLGSAEFADFVLSPFAFNLMETQGQTAEVRVEQIGNEVVVQWSNYGRFHATNVTERINFQVRMNTVNGEIKYVYGGTIVPTATTNAVVVGMRGPSNVYNTSPSVAPMVLSRLVRTTWAGTSTGTAATSTVTTNATNFPHAGLTFTYTPTTCKKWPRTAITVPTATIDVTSAQVLWRAVPGVTGYELRWRTQADPNTSFSAPIAVPGGDTTALLSGLPDNTALLFEVRSVCGPTSKSMWAFGNTFTTNPLKPRYNLSLVNGTYTPITGGTVLFSSPLVYSVPGDYAHLVKPISLDGQAFTDIYVSPKGFITAGAIPTGMVTTSALTSTSNPTATNMVIAPLNANWIEGSSGPVEVRFEETGTEYIFQWSNFSRNAGNPESISFQLRYNKATSNFSFVYGPINSIASTGTAYIGIRKAGAAVHLENVLALDDAGGWPKMITGTAASTTATLSSDSKPQSGFTINWTYTGTCGLIPMTTAIDADEVTHNSATIRWQPVLEATAGYDVRYRRVSDTTTVNTWANPTVVPIGTTHLDLFNLGSDVQYVFEVRSRCSPTVKSFWGPGRLFTIDQANRDASVTQMISPPASSCATARTKIAPYVLNTGLTLIPNPNPVTIYARITRPDLSVVNVQRTYSGITNWNPNWYILIDSIGFVPTTQTGTYHMDAWVKVTGDQNPFNDTLYNYTFNINNSVAAPYTNDFNSGMGAVTSQPTDGGLNWTTASTVSGVPPAEGSGLLIFDVANYATLAAARAYLPCLDIVNSCTNLRFFHSHDNTGLSMSDGTSVMISVNNGPFTAAPFRRVDQLGNITKALRFDPTASGTEWREYIVDLGAYNGKTIRVAFEATGASSTTAPSFAIDNVRVTERSPLDAGITAFTSPLPPPTCASINAPVTVTIRNYGCDTLTSVPVEVSVSGPITQTFNGTYTGSILPGHSANYTITNLNMSVVGTYTFNARTELIGDGDAINDPFVYTVDVARDNTPPIITAQATPPSILINSATVFNGTSPVDTAGGVYPYVSAAAYPSMTDSIVATSGVMTVIEHTVNVTGLTYQAKDLTHVRINIKHTSRDDLDIYLYAPNGSRIRLVSKQGGNNDDFQDLDLVTSGPSLSTLLAQFSAASITTNYTPDQAFSKLTGPANGTWKLRVVDSVSTLGGRFKDFAIEFYNRNLTRQWTQVSGPATITGFPFTGNSPGSRNFATPGSYVFRYTATYGGGCSNQINVPVTVSEGNVWLGVDNSTPTNNWTSPANWAFAPAPPPAGATVVIPDTAPNPPVIGGSVQVANIVFKNEDAIAPNNITVGTGGTLDVKGNITGLGMLMGPGSIIFSGSGVQQISGAVSVGSFSVTNTNLTGLTTIGAGSQLRILPGGTLTMGANARLTIPADGNIVLTSNATGTARLGQMPASAVINGRLSLERYVAGSTPGWYFLTAPFRSGSTLREWEELPARVVPKNNANIFEYTEPDTTRGTYNGFLTETAGWKVPSSTANPINPLDKPKGYRAYLNAQFFGPMWKSKIITSGIPITQNVTASFTRSAAGWDGGGWNLLGNPYPSEIDWNAVKFDPTNSAAPSGNAINVFNGVTKTYATWTATGANTGIAVNGGTRYIASSQAFFIKASAGGSITFKESHKNNGNANTFMRTEQPANVLHFTFAQGSSQDEAAIAFLAGASRGIDEFDGVNQPGDNVDGASAPVAGASLAINVMPELARTEEIPLSFRVSEGQATLSFEGVSSFPETVRTYLRDSYLGTISQVTDGTVLTFAVSADPASRSTGRFTIVFEPLAAGTKVKAAATPSLSAWPNPVNAGSQELNIHLNNFGNGKAVVEVIDVLGKVAVSRVLDLKNGQAADGIGLSGLPKGTYSVRATSAGQSITQHIVVE